MLRTSVLCVAAALAALSGCETLGSAPGGCPGGTCGVRPGPPRPAGRPAPEAAGELRLTPDTARIGFVGSTRLVAHEGHFARFDGRVDLLGDDPKDARITVEIDMASTVTKIGLLTRHLTGADFFDVDHYPTATFVSRAVRPQAGPDQTHVIAGDLTVHGVTRPVEAPAAFAVTPDLLTLDARLTIRQSEFGMTEGARKTADDVPVRISARIARR